MVDWVGLVIPFAYLGLLIGSLATFSSLYRKRKAGMLLLANQNANPLGTLHASTQTKWQIAKSTSLEPWFGPHTARDIYLSLLHIEPGPGQEKAPAVPDSILKAALLQRAKADIHRVLAIRNAKQALSTLLQRGSVGDDLWQRFLRAEKEIEAELRDVVEEANALATNWGNTIFQSANEMVNNEALRQKVAEIQAQGKADREWWDQERATIQSNFMKELDENSGAGAPKPNATTGVEKGGSDEDAVLVEGGGPAASGSAANNSSKGGTSKKRKGKK
ncbi:translocation protein S66 [Pseudocyphellaria aurata]|nr:translocation protein S66 [Pseudocyphellaria aurata]